MYVYEVSPRWSHIGIPAGGSLRKLGTYPVPGAGLRPPSGNQAAARFCLAGEAQVDQRANERAPTGGSKDGGAAC